ncbi:MAG TPA: outer membrane beta-barrel protein [Flavobacterium sp.]|uniref:outer membrane beta-barrel protein n=1 Tax=Flavobacterium sp. TaxID=239 RepID=UPI002DBDBEAB|nr:outer membrane beta-barrel protein [Flavobacterium sp.]HEU4788854.1 outer membrane beta-barrel protein [Flavobacterium sp.]
MKKRFLLAALLFSVILTAQTEKGTFAISGKTGLGFNSTTVKYENSGNTTDGPKTNSFNISPSVSYFIIDNLSLGLDFNYKTVSTKQKILVLTPDGMNGMIIDEKNTNNTLSIIPTATYFFSKGKTRPYLNAGIGFGNTKQENNYSASSPEISNFSTSNNGLVWGAGAGLAYFISKTISFDLGLDYSEFSFKENNVKTKSGAFGANIGISVFLK